MRHLLISILLLGSFTAHAATFNFISYADNDANNDGHHEWGYEQFSVTEDNITLNATGLHRKDNGWQQAYAYLDKGNAGLGVCKVLNTNNQCNPSSDDNVTYREALVLGFDKTVKLDTVLFQNGRHKPNFTGNFSLSILTNNLWSNWETFSLEHIFNSELIGNGFAFYNPNDSTRNSKQFYIETLTVSSVLRTASNTATVPTPSTIILLLVGLIGFSLNSIHKKAVFPGLSKPVELN